MNQITQTELQTRFEKILAKEALMAKAEELANFGSWQANIVNGKVEWSEEMFRIYGYEPGSFEPSVKMFLSHVHPDDVLSVENSLNENGRSGDFKNWIIE